MENEMNTQVTETTEIVNELSTPRAENELLTLKAENERLQAELKSEGKAKLRFYSERQTLLKAFKFLIDAQQLTLEDVRNAIIDSNDLDLESLVYQISK